MGTSERASTGLPGLDTILDHLHTGDNVVWQVASIEDYRRFAEIFVRQALKENRTCVYLRFGRHPEVVGKVPGLKVYQLDANRGFEAFSTAVHKIIAALGKGVFYVFDSLSDLMTAWATDLMAGNFFKVTCPYLFEQDTIAYFAVLRGRCSYQTIARIRETTQVLLDLHRHRGHFYIHPLKVWNRYSPSMFLPHVQVEEDFVPVTSSVEAARFFAYCQRLGSVEAGRKLDYWDQVFLKAQELQQGSRQGELITEVQEQELVEKLCRMMIGRDRRLLSLARNYFSLHDLLEITKRLIGSGFIGGKAVGLLLARNILRNDHQTYWDELLEPHDSFYIGSDVYFTYLVENDCWKLHLEQKKEANYFSAAEKLRERILAGVIPEAIREQVKQMLEYFGQYPIIVRSSSLLEDSFGNAFAGKYESVFCVNQGTPQERYQLFEQAVKQVYAGTMSEDALAYRLQRGLAQTDEQMALLVQRVSGSHHGSYFFPDLSGVGFSHNPYVWKEDLDPKAGMVRLVLGLGTRAVERVEDDYPRIIALDQPLVRPDSSPEDIRRFSQRRVDVLDTVKNDKDTVSLESLSLRRPKLQCWDLVAARDYHIERRLNELGGSHSEFWVLTFEKLLAATLFPGIIRQMLQTLETAYQYPVDVEFTVNFCSEGRLQVNLLQCRPLQTGRQSNGQAPPAAIEPQNLLFSSKGNFMGDDVSPDLQRIIYVEAKAYSALSVPDKYQVARLVGKLNRLLQGTPFLLIGPGRWGTSTPSLGVPVSFAEICYAKALVEVAGQKEGYMPELSFGTHFFQDLVGTHIFYVALFPEKEGTEFNEEWLLQAPNSLGKILPGCNKWQDAIKVIEPHRINQSLWLQVDFKSRQAICHL